MERTQHDGQHQYLASPTEYPIQANENHSTYDQFIQLRDTLVFSGKYYNSKAGLKLCISETEETVEILERQLRKQIFEPDYASGNITPEKIGNNVIDVPADIMGQYQFPLLSCMINKDGRYRIIHKEEILPVAGTKKVYCYVDQYRKDENGEYKLVIQGGIAVFDWQGEFSKTFSCSTPSGSGTCTVSFKLGDIMQKMTSFGTIEKDLKKEDILVLRMRDAEIGSGGVPGGNELTLQQWSNFRSVEYLDLPYNNN